MYIAKANIENIAKEIEIKVKMSKQDLDACETGKEIQDKICALKEIREHVTYTKMGYDECFSLFDIGLDALETVNKRYHAIFAFINYRLAILEDEFNNRFMSPEEAEWHTTLLKTEPQKSNTAEAALAKYKEAWKDLGGEVEE